MFFYLAADLDDVTEDRMEGTYRHARRIDVKEQRGEAVGGGTFAVCSLNTRMRRDVTYPIVGPESLRENRCSASSWGVVA